MIKATIRWIRALARDAQAISAKLLYSRTQLRSRNLLFVDNLVPDPSLGAGYPRAFEIVKVLVAEGWNVTMYPMGGARNHAFRVAAQFPTVKFVPPEGIRGLRRVLRFYRFDAAIVSRSQPMAAYLTAERKLVQTIVIYDAEALIASREASRRQIVGMPWSQAEYEKAVAAELALAQRASAILAVTQSEAALFSSRLNVPVYVAAHTSLVHPSSASFDARRDLLFVGRMTDETPMSPNVDSIVWFVREVMPQLDKKIGSCYKLRLVGLLESAEISAILSDRILASGVVDTLDHFFDEARVFIAPTRYAAGLPLKVVEAMTRGLPCATSPLLKVQLGQASFAEDASAERFADEVASLYLEENVWQEARAAGLQSVADQFSATSFREAIVEALKWSGPRNVGTGKVHPVS